MRKKAGIFLTILIFAAVVAGMHQAANLLYENVISKEVVSGVKKIKIVIDSGHGGADPGKVGINQVLEKDINLKIAEKLKKMLEDESVEIVMTREGEGGLSDSKTEDMKKRIEIINEAAPVLCVSIHQNSYSDEAIKGAQVFYYTHSEKGEKAAEMIQKALLSVDLDNTRQIKANDTYYILKRAEVPTVIVECGFLSNREEADLLNTEEYQQKIAEAISVGIMEYLQY